MLFWLGLVTGLIIGWIVEWLIDWRFWRRDLNASLAEERRWRLELDGAQREIGELKEQLARLAGQSSSNQATITKPDPESAPEPDQLERIKGIGPAFAQRLRKAGITTFAQLAQLSPERIVEIIHPEPRQAIDPASWIAQAKELAPKNQEGS
jgi:predicted flap endonuclease-1-like 5' DNA nuclease